MATIYDPEIRQRVELHAQTLDSIAELSELNSEELERLRWENVMYRAHVTNQPQSKFHSRFKLSNRNRRHDA